MICGGSRPPAGGRRSAGDFAWLDDRTIVFGASGGVGTLDVLTGRERSVRGVLPPQRVVNLALSPDRAWLALTVTDADNTPWLQLVPVAASTNRSLGLHPNATGWAQTWTADGAAILVTRSGTVPTGTDLGEVGGCRLTGLCPRRYL